MDNQELALPNSPTQDELTMATLAHALQIPGWWIAPLIIFLVRRQSRFVSFHALQALLLQIFYVCITAAIMTLWVATIFSTVILHPPARNAPPPLAIFLIFPIVWIGFFGMWALILILSITYAIKAGRGEWAEYPILGPIARKILKLGPNGASLPSA